MSNWKENAIRAYNSAAGLQNAANEEMAKHPTVQEAVDRLAELAGVPHQAIRPMALQEVNKGRRPGVLLNLDDEQFLFCEEMEKPFALAVRCGRGHSTLAYFESDVELGQALAEDLECRICKNSPSYDREPAVLANGLKTDDHWKDFARDLGGLLYHLVDGVDRIADALDSQRGSNS